MPEIRTDMAGTGEAARHIVSLPRHLAGILGDLGRRADAVWHHAFAAQPLWAAPRWRSPLWLPPGSGRWRGPW